MEVLRPRGSESSKNASFLQDSNKSVPSSNLRDEANEQINRQQQAQKDDQGSARRDQESFQNRAPSHEERAPAGARSGNNKQEGSRDARRADRYSEDRGDRKEHTSSKSSKDSASGMTEKVAGALKEKVEQKLDEHVKDRETKEAVKNVVSNGGSTRDLQKVKEAAKSVAKEKVEEVKEDLSKTTLKDVKAKGIDLVKDQVTKAGTGQPNIFEPVRYAKMQAINAVKGTINEKLDETKKEIKQNDRDDQGILKKYQNKFTDEERDRDEEDDKRRKKQKQQQSRDENQEDKRSDKRGQDQDDEESRFQETIRKIQQNWEKEHPKAKESQEKPAQIYGRDDKNREANEPMKPDDRRKIMKYNVAMYNQKQEGDAEDDDQSYDQDDRSDDRDSRQERDMERSSKDQKRGQFKARNARATQELEDEDRSANENLKADDIKKTMKYNVAQGKQRREDSDRSEHPSLEEAANMEMSKAQRDQRLRDEGSGKGKGADKNTMRKWNMDDDDKERESKGDKNEMSKRLSKMQSEKGDKQDQDKSRDASDDFVRREKERRQNYQGEGGQEKSADRRSPKEDQITKKKFAQNDQPTQEINDLKKQDFRNDQNNTQDYRSEQKKEQREYDFGKTNRYSDEWNQWISSIGRDDEDYYRYNDAERDRAKREDDKVSKDKSKEAGKQHMQEFKEQKGKAQGQFDRQHKDYSEENSRQLDSFFGQKEDQEKSDSQDTGFVSWAKQKMESLSSDRDDRDVKRDFKEKSQDKFSSAKKQDSKSDRSQERKSTDKQVKEGDRDFIKSKGDRKFDVSRKSQGNDTEEEHKDLPRRMSGQDDPRAFLKQEAKENKRERDQIQRGENPDQRRMQHVISPDRASMGGQNTYAQSTKDFSPNEEFKRQQQQAGTKEKTASDGQDKSKKQMKDDSDRKERPLMGKHQRGIDENPRDFIEREAKQNMKEKKQALQGSEKPDGSRMEHVISPDRASMGGQNTYAQSTKDFAPNEEFKRQQQQAQPRRESTDKSKKNDRPQDMEKSGKSQYKSSAMSDTFDAYKRSSNNDYDKSHHARDQFYGMKPTDVMQRFLEKERKMNAKELYNFQHQDKDEIYKQLRQGFLPAALTGKRSEQDESYYKQAIDMAAKAKDTVADKASDFKDKFEKKSGQNMEQMKDKAADMGKEAYERAREFKDKAMDKMSKGEGKEQAKDMGNKAMDKGREYMEKAKEQGKDMKKQVESRGREALDRAQDKGKDMMNKAQDKARDLKDKAEEATEGDYLETAKDIAGKVYEKALDLKDLAQEKLEDMYSAVQKDADEKGMDMQEYALDKGKEALGVVQDLGKQALDKASDLQEYIGSETLDNVVDKAADLKDAAAPYVEKGLELGTQAVKTAAPYAIQAKDKAAELLTKAQPIAEKAYEQAKPLAKQAYEQAKPMAEKALEQAKPLAEKALEKGAELKDQAMDAAKPYVSEIHDRLSNLEKQYPEKSTFDQLKDFGRRITHSFTHHDDKQTSNQQPTAMSAIDQNFQAMQQKKQNENDASQHHDRIRDKVWSFFKASFLGDSDEQTNSRQAGEDQQRQRFEEYQRMKYGGSNEEKGEDKRRETKNV